MVLVLVLVLVLVPIVVLTLGNVVVVVETRGAGITIEIVLTLDRAGYLPDFLIDSLTLQLPAVPTIIFPNLKVQEPVTENVFLPGEFDDASADTLILEPDSKWETFQVMFVFVAADTGLIGE